MVCCWTSYLRLTKYLLWKQYFTGRPTPKSDSWISSRNRNCVLYKIETLGVVQWWLKQFFLWFSSSSFFFHIFTLPTTWIVMLDRPPLPSLWTSLLNDPLLMLFITRCLLFLIWNQDQCVPSRAKFKLCN